MTFQVHGFLDGRKVVNWRMEHIPSVGDTMRFAGEKYGIVKEIIWCMDESTPLNDQRINIRIESIESES